jgi:simple sugar transport system ATP-binding protein
VVALEGVSLDLEWGEVHAVMGENGAGKTTLMAILGGFVLADRGEISVDGAPVVFASPRDAMAAGIGMVHQQFRLVEQFTTAENLAMGQAALGRRVDSRAMIAHATELAERFGLALPPNVPVSKLSAGERQRVEILRALGFGARILILDEPTSVLAEQESRALFATIREMSTHGQSVVLISHKLSEVLEVADRVTVLRRGRVVDVVDRKDCDAQMLAHLMVGDDSENAIPRVRRPMVAREARMELADVCLASEQGVLGLTNVSLTLGSSEILGVAGVAGNGQLELAEVVTGLRGSTSGEVRVEGRRLTRGTARDYSNAGVSYIPEDRAGTGLLQGHPIWTNAILRTYRQRPVAWGPVIRRRAARRYASELCARVKLSTTDVDTPAYHLSGGNAQKLLTGRELDTGCRILVAVNITQGLDVAAVAEVWRTLLDARDRGTAILLISSDLDEILALADRIVIMYHGTIVGEFPSDEADRRDIGLLMAGGANRTTRRPSARLEDTEEASEGASGATT